MLLTTTESLPNKEIIEILGICRGSTVRARNIGRDIFAGLKNILIEIHNDLNTNLRENGDLKDWSKQGVLLLNSVLTVENGKPGSHSKLGWEKFTNQVIKLISKKKSNLVFMLWGGYAKKKEKIIYDNQHLILKSGHPSPLSANRGFWFGNKHFSKCNDFLTKHKLKTIKW